MKTETCPAVTPPPATAIHLFVTQRSNRPARIESITGRRIATMADDPTDQRCAKAFAAMFAASPKMLAMLRRCHSAFQTMTTDPDWLTSKFAADLRQVIKEATDLTE